MTTTTARLERRFEPASATPPGLFLLVLNAGALAAGAGAIGFVLRSRNPEAAPFTTECLTAGAALLGVATALAGARGLRVRVGPAGLAFEQRDLVRVPWHGVAELRLEGAHAVVRGKSEFGGAVEERLALGTHRAIVAAIVAEARARVPAVLSDELARAVEGVAAPEGEALPLEPVQIAGKRCAASGKPIAFEGDGVVCARCERVYLAAAKPSACACGADLA